MFVDKKVKEDRLNTCKKCDFYRNFLMLSTLNGLRGQGAVSVVAS
tara:strand:+ start:202 stop:336 length:135 start_codon:yes stop_codon:yes gene_type:complete